MYQMATDKTTHLYFKGKRNHINMSKSYENKVAPFKSKIKPVTFHHYLFPVPF